MRQTQQWMRRFAPVLAVCMLLSCAAFASGEASGGASGDLSGAADIRGATDAVVITIAGGELSLDESLAEVTRADHAVLTADEVSGVMVASDQNDTAGLVWSGDGTFRLGGEEDFFTVDTYFTGESLDVNAAFLLDEPDPYDWGSTSRGGNALTVSGTGTTFVDNIYALSAGIGRYTFDFAAGDTIVRNSCFESVGSRQEYCDMPWFTMQFGVSRNIIMTGQASVYVYNSLAATDGYASWSTDMTSGSMYLYNADCVNYHGGYGTYADGCRVYIYGSTFDCGEYGLFDCNGGTLTVGSSADARTASDEMFLRYLDGQELAEDTPSVIIGDRNAVVMHVVATGAASDEMRSGIVDTDTSGMYNTQPKLYATNSTFSTVGATGTSIAQFPVTLDMYLAHQKGSVMEFRSCNADVVLENCAMESANGVLFQSVIDLDGSAVQILDDIATEDISGICIHSIGNDWTGDIAHEDYQRPMRLTLEDTTLTGAIRAGTVEEWLSLWDGYEDVSYSLDEQTGLYVNDADPSDTAENYRIQDPDEIYGWATAITAYDAVRGVFLTLDADSVWNITGESELSSLTLEPGAVVNGVVTVDGETVDVSAGGAWTGTILVTPASASGEAS